MPLSNSHKIDFSCPPPNLFLLPQSRYPGAGRVIASHLCTAVGGQQFRKEWRKLLTRIMSESYYSFFHYCLLSCRYVVFRKRILSEPKWGAQAAVKNCCGRTFAPVSLVLGLSFEHSCRCPREGLSSALALNYFVSFDLASSLETPPLLQTVPSLREDQGGPCPS